MSSTPIMRKLLWLGSIIVGVILVDQLSKRWIVEWIGPGRSTSRVELLGSFFAFEYLENRGAAFGLFQQSTMILAIVSVLVVSIGIVAMVRYANQEFWLSASIALIIGGAVGNAIDRFAQGFVVDFIAVGRFWKFNLADSAITIGVILTFLLLWQSESKQTVNNSQQEQGA